MIISRVTAQVGMFTHIYNGKISLPMDVVYQSRALSPSHISVEILAGTCDVTHLKWHVMDRYQHNAWW